MTMGSIVVAGGAGFIGSHLVDALLERNEAVVVIDDFSTGCERNLSGAMEKYPDRLAVHRLDIRLQAARELVLDTKPDVVYLLAAQRSVRASMHDPLNDAQINVGGIVNMLEGARGASVRKLVFASSGGTIYGDLSDQDLPLAEVASRRPKSFYGLTKSVVVEYLELYREYFRLDSVTLALGNVYGPRQSPFGEAGVVAIFGKNLLSGEPCVVHGDGLATRDYVYVDDVVRAFTLAGERGAGLYNIGSGVETNVLEVLSRLTELLGVDVKPTHASPLPGEVRRVLLDVGKAEKDLGWKADVGFSDGARAVLDWLKGYHSGSGHPRSPQVSVR